MYNLCGVVFFVSKSVLGIERQNITLKLCNFDWIRASGQVRILIYRTWPIVSYRFYNMLQNSLTLLE